MCFKYNAAVKYTLVDLSKLGAQEKQEQQLDMPRHQTWNLVITRPVFYLAMLLHTHTHTQYPLTQYTYTQTTPTWGTAVFGSTMTNLIQIVWLV